MYKFYKQKLYKKYQDELWGHIINKKSFSYNKKSILLHYRDTVLKNRLRIKTKFKYFRRGFLKNLNYTLFTFKFFRKNLRTFNFKKNQSFRISSLSNFKFKKNRRLFFRASKILTILKLNISQIWLKTLEVIVKRELLHTLNLYPRFKSLKTFNFPAIITNKKKVFYKSKNFLRVNNLQFVIKKKLNLRKQKTFFYSVHIAAPKKKTKKWSLFALKNIYYKKISLFFGFRKVVDFFKVYNLATNIASNNSFAVFLMLEGRLENFLMRLNLFPSIYFIKKFIQYGNVFVNNKIINYSSYNLNFNEIVSFSRKYRKQLYCFIKLQLKRRKVIINLPSFIEADYKLLVAMLVRNPDEFALTKPLSFDLYTRFLSVNR